MTESVDEYKIYNFIITEKQYCFGEKVMSLSNSNLDCSAIRLHYTDTDSFVVSLSKPLDDLVLPGRESVWEREKPKWFVMNPECPDQQRGIKFNEGRPFLFEEALCITNL